VVDYRLYVLDGAGRIATADWVDATGDEEAIMIARNQRQGAKFELWQKDRLVCRIDRTPRG
jgi:hypothetical protein